MGRQTEKKRRAHPGFYSQKPREKDPGKEKPMIRENMSLPRQENGDAGGSEVVLRGPGPALVEQRHPGNSELPLREAESAPCIFIE